MYGTVAYQSPGYDDEFFNINPIENIGFGVVAMTQSTDVHPPGSYLLDWLLYAVFGKWELVRLAISLLTASSLIWAAASYRSRKGDLPGFLLILIMGLNPGILLWRTGLRWYAFFVPVLIWLSILLEQPGWKYWIKCFFGLLVLGYLGYAVFIVALPV